MDVPGMSLTITAPSDEAVCKIGVWMDGMSGAGDLLVDGEVEARAVTGAVSDMEVQRYVRLAKGEHHVEWRWDEGGSSRSLAYDAAFSSSLAAVDA